MGVEVVLRWTGSDRVKNCERCFHARVAHGVEFREVQRDRDGTIGSRYTLVDVDSVDPSKPRGLDVVAEGAFGLIDNEVS